MKMEIKITRQILDDDHFEDPREKDEGMSEEREQAYHREEWRFVGVRASAELKIPSEQGGYWTYVHVSSPGLWGIESDSGEDYFNEVYLEEVKTLKHMIDCLQKSQVEYISE